MDNMIDRGNIQPSCCNIGSNKNTVGRRCEAADTSSEGVSFKDDWNSTASVPIKVLQSLLLLQLRMQGVDWNL
jgi:hypothetical protein